VEARFRRARHLTNIRYLTNICQLANIRLTDNHLTLRPPPAAFEGRFRAERAPLARHGVARVLIVADLQCRRLKIREDLLRENVTVGTCDSSSYINTRSGSARAR
jgi:hypothetical protein